MSAANRKTLLLVRTWSRNDLHQGNGMIADLQVVSMEDFATLDWNPDKQVWLFSVDYYFYYYMGKTIITVLAI